VVESRPRSLFGLGLAAFLVSTFLLGYALGVANTPKQDDDEAFIRYVVNRTIEGADSTARIYVEVRHPDTLSANISIRCDSRVVTYDSRAQIIHDDSTDLSFVPRRSGALQAFVKSAELLLAAAGVSVKSSSAPVYKNLLGSSGVRRIAQTTKLEPQAVTLVAVVGLAFAPAVVGFHLAHTDEPECGEGARRVLANAGFWKSLANTAILNYSNIRSRHWRKLLAETCRVMNRYRGSEEADYSLTYTRLKYCVQGNVEAANVLTQHIARSPLSREEWILLRDIDALLAIEVLELKGDSLLEDLSAGDFAPLLNSSDLDVRRAAEAKAARAAALTHLTPRP
jgi:hypothetical protein